MTGRTPQINKFCRVKHIWNHQISALLSSQRHCVEVAGQIPVPESFGGADRWPELRDEELSARRPEA